jgi:hypothetical protein
MVVTVAVGMHQTMVPKIHSYTVTKITRPKVLLMGVALMYLTVWGVKPLATHQTSWHLESTVEQHT